MRRRIGGTMLVLAAAFAAPALAQLAEGPPSEALANALRLYQMERYEEARASFVRVANGETGDAPGNRQKAEFFLGKSLYHLQRYRESLSIFDAITRRGEEHLYHVATLQWLAQLSTQLPEIAPVLAAIGRYDEAIFAELDTPESQPLHQRLLYLLGRARFETRRFADAERLLSSVRPNAPEHDDARRWLARAQAAQRAPR